jgi:hypothetical protein
MIALNGVFLYNFVLNFVKKVHNRRGEAPSGTTVELQLRSAKMGFTR